MGVSLRRRFGSGSSPSPLPSPDVGTGTSSATPGVTLPGPSSSTSDVVFGRPPPPPPPPLVRACACAFFTRAISADRQDLHTRSAALTASASGGGHASAACTASNAWRITSCPCWFATRAAIAPTAGSHTVPLAACTTAAKPNAPGLCNSGASVHRNKASQRANARPRSSDSGDAACPSTPRGASCCSAAAATNPWAALCA